MLRLKCIVLKKNKIKLMSVYYLAVIFIYGYKIKEKWYQNLENFSIKRLFCVRKKNYSQLKSPGNTPVFESIETSTGMITRDLIDTYYESLIKLYIECIN